MNRFIKNWKKSVLTLAIMLMTTAGVQAQTNWSGTVTFNSNANFAQTITLIGNTTVQVASGVTVTIHGGLIGYSFTLTKTGQGTLRIIGGGQVNSGTTVSEGNFQIGNGETTGTWTGDIVNNANLVFNRSNDYTYAGNISGTGTVEKSNHGSKITLTGNLTYTGNTFVASGTLQIGNGTTGGELNSNVSLPLTTSILRFEPGTHVNYSKVISGVGKVEYKGSTGKMLSFTGNNTYTGTTTVEAGGVLIIGDWPSSATGAVAGNIILNTGAKLDFRRSNAYTYSGVISGAGEIQKFNSSKLTLTGANTYTGATTVEAGTLQIGNGTITTSTINSTSGINLTLTGATLRFELAADLTISKVISGSGKVEYTSNYKTLKFSGNNTYTGTTTIEKGYFWIGDNGTTGDIKGNIIINDADSWLDFRRSDAYTYSGVISGVGNIFKYNTNTVTLNGNNTYTGETRIDDGTLALGTNGSIENSWKVQFMNNNNSKFNVSAGNKKIKSIRSGSAHINTEVVLGSTTLTIGTVGQQDETSDFYGKFTGTGGITKQGTGLFYMQGALHTATGTFTHSQGMVSVYCSSTINAKWAGNYNLQSNGRLYFGSNSDLTVGGNLTLAGGEIQMDLTGSSNKKKIMVTGTVSASGTNTLKITSGVITACPLIEAASGINSTTPYTVESSRPYTHLVATGTQLLFYASETPILPAITTTTLPDGLVGTAYTANLIAEGFAPLTLSFEGGMLPPGLTLAADGAISGTPTAEGTFNFTVKATNPLGSTVAGLSIKVTTSATAPIIVTTTLPSGTTNTAYSAQLEASGTAPITWSLENGNLPAGLTLSATGAISGTPTTVGTFNFTVKAANSAGSDTKPLSIAIVASAVAPIITTTTLPDGAIDTPYNAQLEASGTAPISWSLASGNLPTGLTLSATGAISGTPTTEGTFNFTVQAINSAGNNEKPLSIIITNSAIVPTIITTTLPAGTTNTAYSAQLEASGTAPIAWSLESGNLPDGLTLLSTGTISGTPTAKGTFNFTVKATNSAGNDTQALSIEITNDVNIVETDNYPSLWVYPNPTDGILNLIQDQIDCGRDAINRVSTITEIEVFDVMGRKTLTSPVSLTSPETTLNLAHLPSGVYFLRIQTETGVVVRKVIKQ